MSAKHTTRAWLLVAIATMILCRIPLALLTYGTNDASMWESSARIIRDTGGWSIYDRPVEVRDPQGAFLTHEIFNHPPFMVFVLAGLSRVAGATGIPVRSSLRLLDTLADAGTIALTAAILQSLIGAVPLAPIILIALAPAWLFISGFHGNTDPLMLFFVLLAVYLFEVRMQAGWGALSFALATGIKVVPVCLLPAVFLYLKTWRDRLWTALIIGAFEVVTAFPWLLRSPKALLKNIAGYGSLSQRWGLGLLAHDVPLIGASATNWLNHWGRYFLLAGLVALAWRLNRMLHPVSLFEQCGILLFVFLFLTPGFGIQYLAWLTPWLAVLSWSVVSVWVATSGVFCAAVYTYWSGGVPWFYANSVAVGGWKGWINILGLLTWLATALVLESYWRRVRNAPDQEPSRDRDPRRRAVLVKLPLPL